MPYLFATEDQDYSDFASGRVLYNLPGAPAFPVRLASEIFQRARARLGADRPFTLYDPVCGGAYHLTALGLLHGDSINTIITSDTSAEAVALAQRNLSLLTPAGMQRRKEEIQHMLESYGKESHAEALRSVEVLSDLLVKSAGEQGIPSRVFQANALDGEKLRQELSGALIDLVFSDVPYGQRSAWDQPDSGAQARQDPLWRMLDALRLALPSGALVVIAADKQQKIAHAGYQRIERFQIGKRQVAFLLTVSE